MIPRQKTNKMIWMNFKCVNEFLLSWNSITGIDIPIDYLQFLSTDPCRALQNVRIVLTIWFYFPFVFRNLILGQGIRHKKCDHVWQTFIIVELGH